MYHNLELQGEFLCQYAIEIKEKALKMKEKKKGMFSTLTTSAGFTCFLFNLLSLSIFS